MFTNDRFAKHTKFTDRNTNYANNFFDLVNKYYANWNLPVVKVSYYNFDIENGNMDKSKLNSGAYQLVGDKSGYRWRKVLDFPLCGLQPVNTTPTNDERGTTNSEKLTDAFFPRINGIVPKVHDFIAFDQFNTEDRYILNDPPLYEIVNIEKSNEFEFGFYKIYTKISYATKSQIDMQLNDIIDFVDYEKRLYSLDTSLILNKLLDERSEIKMNDSFDQRLGLYCETVTIGN